MPIFSWHSNAPLWYFYYTIGGFFFSIIRFYWTCSLSNGRRFLFQNEYQGGISTPYPNAIDVPNLGFSDKQIAVLHIMMNKEESDYSTVDEIARLVELSAYSYEEIHDAMLKLKSRGFLLEVEKPYSCVYLEILNVMTSSVLQQSR